MALREAQEDPSILRRRAALMLVDCQAALVRSGLSIATEMIRVGGAFVEWAHLPEGDARDPVSGAQYYYHAHSQDRRPPGEHGHFHTFLRTDEGATHLAGISLDAAGRPFRLFSPNRWVTDEIWRPASETASLLDRFVIDTVLPSWVVNRWLTALLAFYRPQIVALLHARDEALAADQRMPLAERLEDRGREVLAERAIDLDHDLEQALRAV